MRLFSQIIKTFKLYRSHRVAGATVRYMFPAVLGSLVILAATTVTSVEQSFIFFESDKRTVEVGDLVSVEVKVSAHVPINAVDMTVKFPSANLQVFSIDRGQSVFTIWTEDPITTDSSVRFVGGTFKRGFIGEHQVATIKFQAIKAGQYDITAEQITFVAGDGSGNEVLASANKQGALSLFNFDENTTPEELQIAVSSGIVTDLNNDGRVTLQDISAFMGAWSNRTQIFDFNNDGRMTFTDFSIILADYFLR